MDVVKNPVIIGVLVAAITYLYLWWQNKNDKNKKPINLFIPAGTAIGAAILSYTYFNMQPVSDIPTNKLPKIMSKLSSESPVAYHLVSRGVSIPNNINIPDVFVETY